MFLQQIRGQLIVSCQALEDEPLHGPEMMAAMARAAEAGGASGIRANGGADIAAIRRITSLPIIGLKKATVPGFDVYITPTFAAAAEVALAGADMIALDATDRSRPEELARLIHRIHTELGKPVLADCATVAEALVAEAAGADAVATTMAGYTEETKELCCFSPDLVRAFVEVVSVPVIAEGRIWTPEEAARALEAGAHAVVVGSAITRPQEITRRFARAIRNQQAVRGRSPGGQPCR
jgi:N-acylglucosamine-6-phosphate 2-epimerase